MTAPHFRVLTVCTGNIHRSPAARYLLAEGFGPHSGIVVASAGTRAVVGAPVGATMTALLRADGIDPTGFAARRITEPDVRSADLILGMTRSHRGHAAMVWPPAVLRSFTLLEFARAARQLDPGQLEPSTNATERLAALTDLAARVRTPGTGSEDDIRDPEGESDEMSAQVYAEIREAVLSIVEVTRVPRGRHSH